jgi:hypothetical protein
MNIGEMQRKLSRDRPTEGEPCALKGACTVRRGESEDGPRGTAPGSYPTDKDVIITNMSAARIPWPLCKPAGRAHPGLLVDDELARAIRCESSLALQYWWGASQRVVWCWRKALGVPRHNEGSMRLHRMSGEAAAAVLRGVPLSPEAVEQRRQTARELNLGQYVQPCICPNGSRPWTDDELARRIDRSENAVRIKRSLRKITQAKDRRRRN